MSLRKSPPQPPAIPGNVCSVNCNVCGGRWFEGTIVVQKCACGKLRVCPDCASKMGKRVSYEHNLVDCDWVSDSEDETCGADQDVALAAAASNGYADAAELEVFG